MVITLMLLSLTLICWIVFTVSEIIYLKRVISDAETRINNLEYILEKEKNVKILYSKGN